MDKPSRKSSLINLSVEEENLAVIPFAVLERRVGKRVGKIEIRGRKTLPDGTDANVLWQVQGNADLGLPTEQDLDIFVALGVLTYRNNFSKTVTFTGRELAKILNISSVHGKFYQRLKLAMDRFIPLRFRALTATDRQEEVKWLNVFQEFSCFVDHSTGRFTGSVTWTDKVIQAMDRGFFRVLDAGTYMDLDGITAKHLYRYLVVAFERTDMVVIDARRLAAEHLGILSVPKYFSRLMQTLEPAFEQLVKARVLGAWHVVSTADWRIALHRHLAYTPESRRLLEHSAQMDKESLRAYCQKHLEGTGFPSQQASAWCDALEDWSEFYSVQRVAKIVDDLKHLGVVPHVAASVAKRAFELGLSSEAATEYLDTAMIAIEMCHYKQTSGQSLRNAAGLVVKLIKDLPARERLIPKDFAENARNRFQAQREAMRRQHQEAEERQLILDYEEHCRKLGLAALSHLSEQVRESLRKDAFDAVRRSGAFHHAPEAVLHSEVEQLMLAEVSKREAPPFERWRLRLKAQQVVLPFGSAENGDYFGVLPAEQ
ncbi:MAG: replication initiator protein A [Acidobacteria bacterium]|nr:replication initiator protein A [Acidobacteriota bacterium]